MATGLGNFLKLANEQFQAIKSDSLGGDKVVPTYRGGQARPVVGDYELSFCFY